MLKKAIFLTVLPFFGVSGLAQASSTGSWINPKLEKRFSLINGSGIFNKEKIYKNERLMAFGGFVLTKEQVLALSEEMIRSVLQIDDHLWLASNCTSMQDEDLVNHSCDPNAGLKGQVLLVALRDIEPNEEITMDYAMAVHEFIGMDAFKCTCQAKNCRLLITQDDWKLKDLQKRYDGYFSIYLQDKINQRIR